MRCFLKADEAGENRQVAAFIRCLQSKRTSCLIRCLWWVSALEQRWGIWSLGRKRPKHRISPIKLLQTICFRTRSSPCQSLNPWCRPADLLIVYTTPEARTCENQEKKTKEQRLKDQQSEKGGQRTTGMHQVHGEEKRKLKDRKIYRKKCKEELQALYGEVNKRLQKAIKNKNVGQRSLLFKAWWR